MVESSVSNSAANPTTRSAVVYVWCISVVVVITLCWRFAALLYWRSSEAHHHLLALERQQFNVLLFLLWTRRTLGKPFFWRRSDDRLSRVSRGQWSSLPFDDDAFFMIDSIKNMRSRMTLIKYILWRWWWYEYLYVVKQVKQPYLIVLHISIYCSCSCSCSYSDTVPTFYSYQSS